MMSHKNKVWYFFINWTHSFNQNLEKEIANLKSENIKEKYIAEGAEYSQSKK